MDGPLFIAGDALWDPVDGHACAAPSAAQNTDDDLLQFLNIPAVDDGFDLCTLTGPQDAKELLCVKDGVLMEGSVAQPILLDGFEDLLNGSLGSIAMEDLKPGSTLGTAELVKDERMGYVFGMLMDNIMGSTLSDTPQFGHPGESGMVSDFDNRVSDEHLRDLCSANKQYSQELFSKMQVIQQYYRNEKAYLDRTRLEFIQMMNDNLQGQFQLRPESKDEVALKVKVIEEKMDICLSRLQWYCNRLLVQLQIHTTRNKRRRNLDPSAVSALRGWFDCHTDNPYPSDVEKDELSRQTGLSVGQISTWFVNARARYPWRQQAPKRPHPQSQWGDMQAPSQQASYV